MSADKYPCIFSREMETIVYILQIYGKSCDSVLWYHVSKRYPDYPKEFSQSIGRWSVDVISNPDLTLFDAEK